MLIMKDINELMTEFGLNYQQSLFVVEYCVDRNGTQAAIRSGYNCKNNGMAATIAKENIKKHHIKAAIDAILGDRVKSTLLTGAMSYERTLLEINRLASFDAGKLYNEDGSIIPIHQLDEDTRRCIEGVESSVIRGKDGEMVDEVRKVKTSSKQAALDKMMKHHGGYKKDNEDNNLKVIITAEKMLEMMDLEESDAET